jgi:hypothetical protein
MINTNICQIAACVAESMLQVNNIIHNTIAYRGPTLMFERSDSRSRTSDKVCYSRTAIGRLCIVIAAATHPWTCGLQTLILAIENNNVLIHNLSLHNVLLPNASQTLEIHKNKSTYSCRHELGIVYLEDQIVKALENKIVKVKNTIAMLANR